MGEVEKKAGSWIAFKSLRLRTTVVLCAAAIITLFTTGLALRFTANQFLRQQIDKELFDISREICDSWKNQKLKTDDPVLRQMVETHRFKGFYVRICKYGTQTVLRSGDIPNDINEDLSSVATDVPFTRKNYRLMVCKLESVGGPTMHAEVGRSLDLVATERASIDRALLITLALIGVLIPLVGWWLSGLLLRPITQLTHAVVQFSDRKSNQYLPEEGSGDVLDRLAIEINSLLRQSRDELKTREDWLSNSAHHLRGPLAAISANVEVVANRMQEGSSHAMLRNVMTDCKALTKLINQLLMLSEAESGIYREKIKAVRLTRIIKHACSMFEPVASNKNVELKFDEVEECWVQGNPYFLAQVIYNLLDNAIKFTPSQGKVTVQLKLEPNGRNCVFVVADTGTGISSEELPKIKDRFFRGKSSRSKENSARGTGLGLSICEAIIKRHLGRLKIESTLGKGTVITISLQTVHAPPDDSDSADSSY